MEKQSDTRKVSWTRGKCLGKGSFGTVSLAVKESDGAVFAVKSVDLATCLPNQLESLENEVRILRSLSSPYVVGYLGDDVTTSYRNLHMEFLPGGTVVDVASFERRLADVDERILRWHTRCLVSGLKYVHGEGIVHCDVKGKNVLVGPDFTSVKLADFGSAIEMKKGCAGDGCRSLIMPRGSPLWMAPEVIRGEYQGPESDIWSLGCTVIEMVAGKPAWEDRGFNSLRQIGFSDELPELPTQLSELGKDFVDKCLRRDPNQRWSCDQLLQHPFLASASAPNTTGESSPRCVLDFAISSDFEEDDNTENFEASARQRIGKFATEAGVLWESDGWVAVRSYARESVVNCEEGTSTEYPQLTRTEKETEGTSLEFYHCFARNSSNSNSMEWQYRNNEEALGSQGSSNSLRCGGWRCRRCSASPSCRCGSQEVELAVEKAELRFSTFCNLLQLFSCKSRKFRYILLAFFKYYSFVTIFFPPFFTFLSRPQIYLLMRFRP